MSEVTSAEPVDESLLSSPSAISNAKLDEQRRRAMRLFNIGYVIDADKDADAAVVMPAERQARHPLALCKTYNMYLIDLWFFSTGSTLHVHDREKFGKREASVERDTRAVHAAPVAHCK